MPGKPALFGTTRAFLDYFNLKSLDDLPSLAEIRDMDSFEPELDFETGSASEAEDDDAGEDGGAEGLVAGEENGSPTDDPRPCVH